MIKKYNMSIDINPLVARIFAVVLVGGLVVTFNFWFFYLVYFIKIYFFSFFSFLINVLCFGFLFIFKFVIGSFNIFSIFFFLFKIIYSIAIFVGSVSLFVFGDAVSILSEIPALVVKDVTTYLSSFFPYLSGTYGFQFRSIRGFGPKYHVLFDQYGLLVGVPIAAVSIGHVFVKFSFQFFLAIPYFFFYVINWFGYFCQYFLFYFFSFFVFVINFLFLGKLSLYFFIFFCVKFTLYMFLRIIYAYMGTFFTYKDLKFLIQNFFGFSSVLGNFFSINSVTSWLHFSSVYKFFYPVLEILNTLVIPIRDFRTIPAESLLLFTDSVRLDPKRISIDLWLIDV